MANLEQFIKAAEDRLMKGAPRFDGDASFPNKAFRADLTKLIEIVKVLQRELKGYATLPDGRYGGPDDMYENLGEGARVALNKASAIAGAQARGEK